MDLVKLAVPWRRPQGTATVYCEIVIVDDASTDNSTAVFENFLDPGSKFAGPLISLTCVDLKFGTIVSTVNYDTIGRQSLHKLHWACACIQDRTAAPEPGSRLPFFPCITHDLSDTLSQIFLMTGAARNAGVSAAAGNDEFWWAVRNNCWS